MARRKWNIKVQIEELRAWLDGMGMKHFLIGGTKRAEQEFRAKQPREAVFAGAVRDLGTYRASLAAHEILTAKADAWPSFKLGMRFYTAGIGVYLELYAGGRFPHLSLVHPIEALTASMALRFDDFTPWCYGRLKASLACGLFGNYWELSPYFPFVMALAGRLQRDEIDLGGPKVSPLMGFQGVFDHWNDPDPAGMEKAILHMCDFHVDHCLIDHTPSEFGRPSNDWPAEVLSLVRVREELGLATPQVDHPLLNTPLMQTPKEIRYFDGDVPERPLIERMLAFIQKDVPSLAGESFLDVFG